MKSFEQILKLQDDSHCFIENSENSIEIAHTIIALANSNGGSILLGVNKKRKVIGINPEPELQKVKDIISAFCDPNLKYELSLLQDDFKFCLEINICKSSKLLYCKNGNKKEYYILENQTLIKLNKIYENVLKSKNKYQFIPSELSNDEFFIFNLIHENQKITLSQIYKKSNLPLKIIDEVLVRLICWNKVDVDFSTTVFIFSTSTN